MELDRCILSSRQVYHKKLQGILASILILTKQLITDFLFRAKCLSPLDLISARFLVWPLHLHVELGRLRDIDPAFSLPSNWGGDRKRCDELLRTAHHPLFYGFKNSTELYLGTLRSKFDHICVFLRDDDYKFSGFYQDVAPLMSCCFLNRVV